MSSREYPGLGLNGDWAYGEDGWKTGMDLNLFRLSVIVSLRVIEFLDDLADLPVSPSEGDIYVVRETTGTPNNAIYIRDEANWAEMVPTEGMTAWDMVSSTMLTYTVADGWIDATNAAKIKTLYESNADTNAFNDVAVTKLAGIEANATADQTGSEIKALYEGEANTNAFTDAEKTKLAGLASSSFLGVYSSFAALTSAHPSPIAGAYAYVDLGVGDDIVSYIWDATDSQYVSTGGTGSDSPALVKSKYESNSDTNAFTDAEQTKLSGIETGATADQTNAEIVAAVDAQLGNTSWKTLAFSVDVKTANYSTVSADFAGNKLIRMNLAGANTFTVDPSMANGEPLAVSQMGAGQTTIVAGSGVTLLSAGGALKLRSQYSAATVMKVGTNTYLVSGDIVT